MWFEYYDADYVAQRTYEERYASKEYDEYGEEEEPEEDWVIR